ncbi:MAG: hypothetical protein LBU34_12300 [Planctomycetaceae bacterium]|nr:hypothetical protein [Planctomycetaceae bacterium]
MCITVGGAKRNLRIGISNPTKGRQPFADFAVKNSQGRQSFAEGLSPNDCVGVSRQRICTMLIASIAYRQATVGENPSAKGRLPLKLRIIR